MASAFERFATSRLKYLSTISGKVTDEKFEELAKQATEAIVKNMLSVKRISPEAAEELTAFVLESALPPDEKTKLTECLATVVDFTQEGGNKVEAHGDKKGGDQKFQSLLNPHDFAPAWVWACTKDNRQTTSTKLLCWAKLFALMGIHRPNERTCSHAAAIPTFFHGAPVDPSMDMRLSNVREFKRLLKLEIQEGSYDSAIALPTAMPQTPELFKEKHPLWYRLAYTEGLPIPHGMDRVTLMHIYSDTPCRSSRSGVTTPREIRLGGFENNPIVRSCFRRPTLALGNETHTDGDQYNITVLPPGHPSRRPPMEEGQHGAPMMPSPPRALQDTPAPGAAAVAPLAAAAAMAPLAGSPVTTAVAPLSASTAPPKMTIASMTASIGEVLKSKSVEVASKKQGKAAESGVKPVVKTSGVTKKTMKVVTAKGGDAPATMKKPAAEPLPKEAKNVLAYVKRDVEARRYGQCTIYCSGKVWRVKPCLGSRTTISFARAGGVESWNRLVEKVRELA